jgi:hypothetical protein
VRAQLVLLGTVMREMPRTLLSSPRIDIVGTVYAGERALAIAHALLVHALVHVYSFAVRLHHCKYVHARFDIGPVSLPYMSLTGVIFLSIV